MAIQVLGLRPNHPETCASGARVQVWNSYSCNNSSSYRLVARFETANAASETASELGAFFAEHAKQMDVVMENGDFPEENPEAAQELARKYGFAWKEVLTWGDEMLEGDEPSIAAENEVLVVYHTYCGGFGEELPLYLKAKGAASVEKEERDPPTASVLFAYAGGNEELDKDLAMLFEQVDEEKHEVEPLKTPWKTRWESYGRAAFFRDAKTVGMWFPIAPTDLPAMKGWLTERGIPNPSIRLCEYGDEAKFRSIAAARCSSCQSRLEYLDPRVHDIETEQLACTKCGGMFDLAALAKPAPST